MLRRYLQVPLLSNSSHLSLCGNGSYSEGGAAGKKAANWTVLFRPKQTTLNFDRTIFLMWSGHCAPFSCTFNGKLREGTPAWIGAGHAQLLLRNVTRSVGIVNCLGEHGGALVCTDWSPVCPDTCAVLSRWPGEWRFVRFAFCSLLSTLTPIEEIPNRDHTWSNRDQLAS